MNRPERSERSGEPREMVAHSKRKRVDEPKTNRIPRNSLHLYESTAIMLVKVKRKG